MLVTIDHSASYRELVQLVKRCVCKDDYKIFRKNRSKRFKRLYREWQKEECILKVNEETNEIYRFAHNVRAILIDKKLKIFWVEDSRRFVSEDEIFTYGEPREVWSISETSLPGEDSLRCLQRALRQEMGVKMTIPRLSKRAMFTRLSHNTHPSSTYPGITSHVASDWYDVDVTGLTLKPQALDNGIVRNWIKYAYPGELE